MTVAPVVGDMSWFSGKYMVYLAPHTYSMMIMSLFSSDHIDDARDCARRRLNVFDHFLSKVSIGPFSSNFPLHTVGASSQFRASLSGISTLLRLSS